jgi:hypothetical protein
MLFFTLKILMGMQNQAGGAAKVGARCTQLVYRTAIGASIKELIFAQFLHMLHWKRAHIRA